MTSVEKTQENIKKEAEKIKEEALVKLKNKEPVEYHITYDTFGQTLEPIYFWVLDFLRNDSPSGLGLEVEKIEEEFEASAGGAFFGELGARATVMQDRAMAILKYVNGIIKEIINLIYDLREYDMRLEVYNDADNKKQQNKEKRQAAEYSLKSIWMDQVDIKTGLGSINNLTRGDLQFITLRDAFMQARSISDVNKIDLNKRVKIILKKKLEEYFQWRIYGEKELRRRYSIEKNYLRSQVDSLKLYTKWARPYLRAAQKLGMKELNKGKISNPDIIAAFNNMQMELSLFAKKEIKPSSIFPSYKRLKFSKKYYSCIEVNFSYRTAPQSIRAGQSTHFAHVGVVDIYFKAYALTEEELKKIEMQEIYEDMSLVEHLTDQSLKDLQEDLNYYLETEEKPKEEKQKTPNPLKALVEIFSNIKGFTGSASKYQEEKVKEEAKNAAKSLCLVAYDVFKKSHRMITW